MKIKESIFRKFIRDSIVENKDAFCENKILDSNISNNAMKLHEVTPASARFLPQIWKGFWSGVGVIDGSANRIWTRAGLRGVRAGQGTREGIDAMAKTMKGALAGMYKVPADAGKLRRSGVWYARYLSIDQVSQITMDDGIVSALGEIFNIGGQSKGGELIRMSMTQELANKLESLQTSSDSQGGGGGGGEGQEEFTLADIFPDIDLSNDLEAEADLVAAMNEVDFKGSLTFSFGGGLVDISPRGEQAQGEGVPGWAPDIKKAGMTQIWTNEDGRPNPSGRGVAMVFSVIPPLNMVSNMYIQNEEALVLEELADKLETARTGITLYDLSNVAPTEADMGISLSNVYDSFAVRADDQTADIPIISNLVDLGSLTNVDKAWSLLDRIAVALSKIPICVVNIKWYNAGGRSQTSSYKLHNPYAGKDIQAMGEGGREFGMVAGRGLDYLLGEDAGVKQAIADFVNQYQDEIEAAAKRAGRKRVASQSAEQTLSMAMEEPLWETTLENFQGGQRAIRKVLSISDSASGETFQDAIVSELEADVPEINDITRGNIRSLFGGADGSYTNAKEFVTSSSGKELLTIFDNCDGIGNMPGKHSFNPWWTAAWYIISINKGHC